LRALLASQPTDDDIVKLARKEGMRSLSDVALGRVAKGETTVEEVERVLGVVPSAQETAKSVGPVLVVDDEAQDRLVARSILEGLGFAVVEAADGMAAKRMLDEGAHDFALVLLDLFMPEMDGAELLREMRRSLATQSLPVIVLTASPDPQDEIELLEAGADDYLLKPVVVDRVEARVRAVLRRSGVVVA
jgi:CheY-like chemotaxis protein